MELHKKNMAKLAAKKKKTTATADGTQIWKFVQSRGGICDWGIDDLPSHNADAAGGAEAAAGR